MYVRHGVILWGGSPLYVNPVYCYNVGTSISRKQGHHREVLSEGSAVVSGGVGAGGEKSLATRLAHNLSKPLFYQAEEILRSVVQHVITKKMSLFMFSFLVRHMAVSHSLSHSSWSYILLFMSPFLSQKFS